MSFLKPNTKVKRNFDLFSGFAWYVPGVGGMFAFLLWLFAGMLLGAIVLLVLKLFYSAETVSVYGTLVTYPLSFVPALIYASARSRRNALFEEGVALDSRNYGGHPFWLLALLVVFATLLTAYLTDIVSYGTYLLTQRSPMLSRFYDWVMEALKDLVGAPLWVSLLSVSVMAPLFEEWLCRGEVLRGLLQKMRPGWAIVVSALFFAVIHANPWQAVPAFALGCLFGYVYYKTGSLWLTILMHCANNTLAVLAEHFGGEDVSEAEHFIQLMEPQWYWLIFAASALGLILIIRVFRRIPLRGRSNCDPVGCEVV